MKKNKAVGRITALFLSIVFLLTACATGGSGEVQTSEAKNSESSVSSTANVTMTDVGTPRAETLIIMTTTDANAGMFNPYLSGSVSTQNGFRQCVYEPLWDIDPIVGEQVPILAESMAEPVDDTYTKFKVKLRQGIKWSDGEDFNADDVVFTSDLLLNNPKLSKSASFSSIVKSITAIDDYTIQIETVSSQTRLEQLLGVTDAATWFVILPQHIWENVDPTTYTFEECIGTGPYVFKDYDENGSWFLFEKRDDWDCSAMGIISGEPVPKYCLFRAYGTEDTLTMAAINNEIDVMYQVSPENLTVLMEQNSEVLTWEKTFPYCSTDASAVGLMYNCAVEPFDRVNVRWALVLALKLENLSMAAQSGYYKASALAVTSKDNISAVYHETMLDWLKSFSLSDGYQPFDDSYAENIAATLREQGIEGIPSDEAELKDLFGVGWWRYDTNEAEKLLLAEGFTRDGSGKWLLPDGSPFQITLAAPSYMTKNERLCYAIAGEWQDFGIDAVVQSCDYASFQTVASQGTADCWLSWPNATHIPDLTASLRGWRSDGIAVVGENTPGGYNVGCVSRWASDKVDEIINELDGLTADDPSVVELTKEYFKEVIENGILFTFTGNKQVNPVTTHYWTGFPTSDNAYMLDCSNRSFYSFVLPQLKPTGNQ